MIDFLEGENYDTTDDLPDTKAAIPQAEMGSLFGFDVPLAPKNDQAWYDGGLENA